MGVDSSILRFWNPERFDRENFKVILKFQANWITLAKRSWIIQIVYPKFGFRTDTHLDHIRLFATISSLPMAACRYWGIQ